MKVFISWSGDRSKAVADALYQWLPTIIQSVEPWMSEHDIDKGTRNIPAISKNLEETHFGLICLTPENLTAAWLLFEAGALSKAQENARVWTFLYELENTDVEGPLSQFQHTKAKEDDVRKLLLAINRASVGAAITEQQLQISFDRGWPELAEKLRNIPPTTEPSTPKRSKRELIEESLTLLRKIAGGDDDSYLGPLLNADSQLWLSLEILKYKFELVETESVPPMDLRPEVEELIQKARRLRTRIKNLRGEIPLRIDVLWRELMQLKEKVRKSTEQLEKEYGQI
jgi:TIR domain